MVTNKPVAPEWNLLDMEILLKVGALVGMKLCSDSAQAYAKF